MLDELHNDKAFVNKLTEIVEVNLGNEHFGVNELVAEMGTSRSHIHRRLKSITNQSVSQFIRELRLEKAKEMLQKELYTVAEIAYKVGFKSPTYFNKCFRDYYGFTPGEAGKVKVAEGDSDNVQIPDTEPNVLEKRSKIMFIFSVIVVIISLTVSFILLKPFSSPNENIEKSIAVLPFIDDSPEEGHAYIVEGLMEEILNKLSLIGDLRVISRTSVEKFRDSKKSIKEIADELNTSYLLEGSAQTIHNTVRIRLQLIETRTDKHLWAKPYEREVNIGNIFKVQSELALLVANELNAVITSDEEKQIAKKPTANLTAYNLYLHGLDYLRLFEYRPLRQSWQELPKAKQLFQEALLLDSTFADAYLKMGDIYINKINYWGNIYLREHYLDSGLIFIEKALYYDEKNWEAKALKGKYFLMKGMDKEANEIFETLPILEDKIYEYYKAAFNHFLLKDDFYNAIRSYLKYEELKPKDVITLPSLLYQICWLLTYTGYPEPAREYAQQFIKMHNDSIRYLHVMHVIETMSGNFNASLEYCQQTCKKNPTKASALYYLMINSVYLKEYSNAYNYLVRYDEKYINGQSAMMLGFVYLKNDKLKEADEHFKKALKIIQDEIKLNTFVAQNYYSHSYLACVYSVLGEKEKAMEYLKQLKKRKTFPLWMIISMKQWPLLENIRQEPGFAEILADMEAKYQIEHKRVGELLRKQRVIE